MKRKLLAVVFVMLLAGAWGCTPQESHPAIGFGYDFFDDMYHAVYQHTGDKIDFMVFFNVKSLGIWRPTGEGTGPGAAGVDKVRYKIKAAGQDFRMVSYPQQKELEIDSSKFQLSDGAVFLCDVRDDRLTVKQVQEQTRATTPEIPEVQILFNAEVKRLVRMNPIVTEFVEKGGFGEGN